MHAWSRLADNLHLSLPLMLSAEAPCSCSPDDQIPAVLAECTAAPALLDGQAASTSQAGSNHHTDGGMHTV